MCVFVIGGMAEEESEEGAFVFGWSGRFVFCSARASLFVFSASLPLTKQPMPNPKCTQPTNHLDLRAVLWLEEYLMR